MTGIVPWGKGADMASKRKEQISAENTMRMRQIFNQLVAQGPSYSVVLGFVTEVKVTYMVVASKTTTTYINFIVGFRHNEIVLIPTSAALDGAGQPIFLPIHAVTKAKSMAIGRQYLIHAPGIGPKDRIQLQVPPGTSVPGYVPEVLQPEASQSFREFFKTYQH